MNKDKDPFNINHSLDKLPVFWPRNVIFFANIMSLFYGNKNETEMLKKEVGALETYGGRLIPILNLIFSGGNNILILEKNPDRALIDYFSSLGLTIPSIRLIPDQFYDHVAKADYTEKISEFLNDLKSSEPDWIEGYVTDHILSDIAHRIDKKLIGSIEGSQIGNNKCHLFRYIRENDLPTFDTFEADDFEAILSSMESLLRLGYKYAVIKAQVGASGIGMVKLNLKHNITREDLPEYLFFEGVVLVQGWLDNSVDNIECIASPSIQIYVDDASCTLYDITEQILTENSIHEGNISPPPFFQTYPEIENQMIEQAHIVCKWLSLQGYRGTASIDYHIVKRKDVLEVRICEVNARVTGATYPSVLAKYFLPHSLWMMRNVRFSDPTTSDKILAVLQNTGLLFDKQKEEGVLPINFNADNQNQIIKGQFLFLANDFNRAKNLMDTMKAMPNLFGRYDRD